MSKLLGIVGLGAGIAVGMYLLDPDRGRTRRAKLADQAGAVTRKAGEKAQAQARYQKGVVQGIAHDITEPFRTTPRIDDDTLLQKVRSEALGRWQGQKKDVDIGVEGGMVTLSGPVDAEEAAELVRLVSSVAGVSSIVDEMTIPQRS